MINYRLQYSPQNELSDSSFTSVAVKGAETLEFYELFKDLEKQI